MKTRILIVFLGMLLLGTTILLRAAWLQFLPNVKLNTLKNRQFQTMITLPARRGPVVDKDGRELAMSAAAYSLYADPKIIAEKKQVARKIAKELGVTSEVVFSKIRDGNRRFAWIQRRIPRAKMEKIADMKIHGLSFVEEWTRVYPNENLMSQVLGFLGSEGQGLEGLELQFEESLKGNQKKVSVKRDAHGRPLISEGLLFTENPEGHEIQLTVDSELQYQLEAELAKTVQEFEANGAVGVILDAKTSAIRALASAPTYDANKANNIPAEMRRNRNVTDFFEPGSVIKPFVVATGLKAKMLQPNSKFFCEYGQWKLTDRIIRESDSDHKFGSITVSEILAYSSNIGMGKIALQMGAEKVRGGLEEFGFGAKTGVDLPGEVRGILHPLPWNPHLLATNAFGQGMAATSLQIATAYAALANGGILRSPYIVEKIQNIETGESQEFQPKSGKRVISEAQAEQMRMLLTAVTQKGATGFNARVPGFQVAGKTGTAQKALSNGRGYEKGAYVASFAGMIPAHKPEYVIYVAVDRPRKSFYAASVAAPLFSRVASFAIRKSGLAPTLLGEENYVPKANVKPVAAKEDVAQDLASSEILSQPKTHDAEVLPDLKDLTLRQVIQKIQGHEVKLKTVGTGRVVETWPKTGESLPEDGTLVLYLKEN
jgi:cell division protein FtsI (penicillin-binding protein 3)